MSLHDARLPRLSDKLKELAENAEKEREVLEEKDVETQRIIRRKSRKN